MAEARSAVSLETLEPSIKRTSTRQYIMLTQDMIQTSIFPSAGKSRSQVVWYSARAVYRAAVDRVLSIKGAVSDLLFPTSELSFAASMVTAGAIEHYLPNVASRIGAHIPFTPLVPEGVSRISFRVVVTGTAIWLGGVVVSRTCLRLMLGYKGYLYDSPKQVSWKTRCFFLIVRLLLGFGSPRTYSYQGFLPSLPVPSLSETCQKYLDSVRPLLDDVEYDRMERLAEEFRTGVGKKLQLCLQLKSLFTNNYVTDWWLRFVYLRGRAPIMINSNYYCMDSYEWTPTNKQVARAANLVNCIMHYKLLLDKERLQPLMFSNTVPLCMAQYRRTFGTTRIPGVEEDSLMTVNSRHIAVMCGGHFYIFNVIDDNGRILLPRDLEGQFQAILQDAKVCDEPSLSEKHLASMTATDRVSWARFRETHMAEGVTRASLDAIERALFMVVLDESHPEKPRDSVNETNEVALSLLHGNGCNRWFDKSFNMVVFANGKVGFNCEHSWADAPVAAHLFEYSFALEFNGPGYDDVTGMNKAVPSKYKTHVKAPLRLRWNFSAEAETEVLNAYKSAQEQISDLVLRVVKHDAYSKGFIKKCKLSPDGYIQMALQLAYYRDAGRFTQTYESSMTRLFRDGRTETVRPVTMESVEFVRAMEDPSASNQKKASLLRKAVERHVNTYRDAMCGRGIDRHLFCLYIMAIALGSSSPFLKEIHSVPWRLSTSQTPAQQTTLFDVTNNPNKLSGGGGFGPVADDGYGVSYIIVSDEVIFFHITSKKTSVANAGAFAKKLVEALSDMRIVVSSLDARSA